MLETVRAWIKNQGLINAGDHVLAACSGGPDSVVLVHILHSLQNEYKFLLSAAHVDHMFRGRASEQDAEFVACFCKELGIPLYQTKEDVTRYSKETGLSKQEAGRVLRFQFLRRTAGELGNALIATGHHRDDQAETVLINLLRGAGNSGLKGMRAKEKDLIRPLLSVSRCDIEQYCRDNRLSFRIDSSNLTVDYLRNRIRLELLPHLETNYNPNLTDALWRMSQIAADEQSYMRHQAETSGVLSQESDRVFVARAALGQLPRALQREIIRLALEKCRGNLKGISFEHVEKLIEITLFGRVGAIMPFPGGQTAKVGYATVEIGTFAEASDIAVIEPQGIQLTIPGTTGLPELGLSVQSELLTDRPLACGRMQAVLDWDALQPPIYVRTRVQGDRFHPIGMTGTKKLKDYFIDEKIPRQERNTVAVFCDNKGILWIGGYRQSERGKTSGNTKTFLRLTIDKQEDILS